MVEKRFPRVIESLASLTRFVHEFFAQHGLPAEETFHVDLVLEELFTNMVRHARGGREEIAVALDHAPSVVTLRLRDFDVEPWELSQAPEPDLTLPIEDRRPGGLGLFLVRQFTTRLQYEHSDGVTTVTAELEVPA